MNTNSKGPKGQLGKVKCKEYDFGHILCQEQSSLGLDYNYTCVTSKSAMQLYFHKDQPGVYLIACVMGQLTLGEQTGNLVINENEMSIVILSKEATSVNINKGISGYFAIKIDSILSKPRENGSISQMIRPEGIMQSFSFLKKVKGDYHYGALLNMIGNSNLPVSPKVPLYQTTMALIHSYLDLITNQGTAINCSYQMEKTIMTLAGKPFRLKDLDNWGILEAIVNGDEIARIAERSGCPNIEEFAKEFKKVFGFDPLVFRLPGKDLPRTK